MRIVVRFLLIMAALLGGVAAWAWAPDLPVADLAPTWAPPPSRFIPIEGMQVHVRDEGPRDDSLPLLLIHGTSSSLHTWDGWSAPLRTTRRVIRLDTPGFGLTGPFAQGGYDDAHYHAVLATLLDSLGVRRAVLVGNSMGGELGWTFAVTHPDRVAGVVLVDAAGLPRTSTSIPIGFRLARMGLGPVLEYVLPRALVTSSVRNTYGEPSRVTDATVDRYIAITRRAGNRRALPLRFAASADTSFAPRVREVRVPTLIVWGLRDHLIPPDHAEKFHAAIAGSTVATFDDLGHVPMEEAPERTLVPVVAFLDRHFPRAAATTATTATPATPAPTTP